MQGRVHTTQQTANAEASNKRMAERVFFKRIRWMEDEMVNVKQSLLCEPGSTRGVEQSVRLRLRLLSALAHAGTWLCH